MSSDTTAGSLVLDASDLTKIYGSGHTEVVAVRDATLRVARGEIVALLGPSGAGKSTLLTLVELAAFDDAWHQQLSAAEPAAPVRFNQAKSAKTLHGLADRMLAAFMDSPASRPDGDVVGVEEELRIILDPDLPDLLARIDLVTQNDSGLCITDFKTARSRWTQDKALETGEQLLLYGAAVRQTSRDPDLLLNLQYAVITKAKNPIVQLLPVPFDANRVAMLRDNVAAVWQAIQGGHFYPNPSPMNCTTCPYRSMCPVFGGK